jgi:hypothetical protein
MTKEVVSVKVVHKERVAYGSGKNTSHKYLVYTDTETFECTDILVKGKFNSSDIYGKMRIDSTYTINVYGYRLPYFSYYRNIISIETK